MHIIYKVTYKPHLNTRFPKFYIGSKYNYRGNYFGSVSSQTIHSFTENTSLEQWWKSRKQEDFLFEVLECFDDITPGELVVKEREYHDLYHVEGPDYFNASKACKGFFSSKKSNLTKERLSKSLKEFYSTPEGVILAKKQGEKRKGKQRPDNVLRNSGKKLSEERKRKISLAAKGKKLSEDHKKAISNKLKGIIQPRSKCNVCGTETTNANISKHHNEKCKRR